MINHDVFVVIPSVGGLRKDLKLKPKDSFQYALIVIKKLTMKSRNTDTCTDMHIHSVLLHESCDFRYMLN